MLTDNVLENLRLLRSESFKVYPDSTILADLALTQAVHESGVLTKPSSLARNYNNLFGIKGKGLTGKSVLLPTWEEVNGKVIKVKEPFAFNDSLEDSFKQHRILMSRPRYQPVVLSNSLDEAFLQIYKCGYATDSKYTKKLQDVYKVIISKLNS